MEMIIMFLLAVWAEKGKLKFNIKGAVIYFLSDTQFNCSVKGLGEYFVYAVTLANLQRWWLLLK